ncbi:1908_t:CDS:2 [Dentiscutata erythropus]|uniref:1908_t:CDS:1 n=1 Tax=Dentiscutata erythropus TaxID=1348616 RepID=A0A9N9E0G8_9GLOM|nr:1908_t:CDS:2 [Dentiscutata erythropus]
MSASTSQNEDFIVEVTTEEKEPEERESEEKESEEKEYEDKENELIKYCTISPEESELDKFHNLIEPWLCDSNANLYIPQNWFYLDEKKEKILLIGNHSIQVWYNRGPEKGPRKRSLEFIHVPFPQLDNWVDKTMKVIDIKYCIGKFNLKIQIEDAEGTLQIKQIKIEDEYDIINVVRDHELVNDILSFGKLVHIPQYFSWSDSTMLACFLEYYSNNAVRNIGWMNTVVDIIPKLYRHVEKIIKKQSDAFSDAVKNSKPGVYRFQIDYIHEFALLEKSLELNNLVSKFNDKIRAKNIRKMKSKPFPYIQMLNKSELESWSIEDCKFIWEEYWFLED